MVWKQKVEVFFETDLLSAVGGAQHAGIHRKPDTVATFFLSNFDESTSQTAESIASKCSGLFGWSAFHQHLDQLDTNGRGTKMFDEIGVDWIKRSLQRKSPVFHLFLKYWLEHCQLVEGTERTKERMIGWRDFFVSFFVCLFLFVDAEDVIPHLDFRLLVPYRSLVRSFLVAFAEDVERPRSMTDCAVALLGVEPGILNFLFKTVFLSTDATDFSAVLDALSQCELWFKQLVADNETLPADFDYGERNFFYRFFFLKKKTDFVCVGFDRILSLEHHVITARLLSLLYNFSNVFVGDGRLKVFGNLLIARYGFQLFLSWDVNTRSIYHQILVFRLLRQSRKQLQSQPSVSTVSKVFEQDRILLTKQEALIRAIKLQTEEKEISKKKSFDPHLEVYATKAMEEWQGWMVTYNDCTVDEVLQHKLQVMVKAPTFKA